MQPGTRLGHYTVTGAIGAGGMGEVYRARDEKLGRDVALKILPGAVAADPARLARFEREARTVAGLNHPHIVHLYAVEESDSVRFITMELVEGRGLDAVVADGPLDPARIREIGAAVADALATAHAQGVVHRDLKPANVMLTSEGRVKVLDFGLAKVAAGEDVTDADDQMLTRSLGLTRDGAVIGTVPYMSPEQVRGQPVDHRSDIFSLGVLLYELAAGERPFGGQTGPDITSAILRDRPRPVDQVAPGLSSDLGAVIGRCLDKDPDQRFQSADDLRDALQALASAPGHAAPSGPSAARTASGWPRRRGAALAAFAVVAVAAAAWFLVPRTEAGVRGLAVLPFENESGDEDVAYLCSGISESLINTLSRVPELKVISRRSAFAIAERGLEPDEIGRELGVETVLMGRVVQHGDEVTLSAELVQTDDNRQIWGQRYVRPVGQLQDLEEEISRAIGQQLKVALVGREESAKPEIDPEAYRLYLMGREFSTGTRREMDKGIDYYQQAIARDGRFALAWAGLAQAYTTQSYLRGSERDQQVELARSAALKALELDPRLAEAHTAIGYIRVTFDLDWEGAEKAFRRGVDLAPGSLVTIVGLGDYFLFRRQYDAALAQYKRAMELDPFSVGACHDLAIVHLAEHRYDLAEKYFRRAVDLHPNWTWGWIKLGVTLSRDGRFAEALEAAAQGEALLAGSGTPAARSWLTYTYALSGEEERARQELAELKSRAADEYVDPLVYSEVHLALGEMDLALDAMEQSVAERSPNLVYLYVLPDLFSAELADEPRFQALLQQIGLGGV